MYKRQPPEYVAVQTTTPDVQNGRELTHTAGDMHICQPTVQITPALENSACLGDGLGTLLVFTERTLMPFT